LKVYLILLHLRFQPGLLVTTEASPWAVLLRIELGWVLICVISLDQRHVLVLVYLCAVA